jgi:hypothetical protein
MTDQLKEHLMRAQTARLSRTLTNSKLRWRRDVRPCVKIFLPCREQARWTYYSPVSGIKKKFPVNAFASETARVRISR